jgi:hypothetical protein
MTRNLLLLVVAAVIAVDGYVYGLWTGRWTDSKELAAAVARLDRLPMTIGNWKGVALELDSAVVQKAGISGYVLRRYENLRGGAAVNVLIACGRPGPLAVHTPEACFRGAGYHMTSESATRQSLAAGASGSAEFFKATFVRENVAVPENMRVLWCWHKGGAWVAPDNPRWRFAGMTVLHKVYVAQPFVPRNEATDGEACQEFLRDLLPELDKMFTPDG